MITPVRVTKQSPFLGESCALCKAPFAPGDDIVICPEDATRHHVPCWRANGGKCAALGCQGHGEVDSPSMPPPQAEVTAEDGRSKVRALPSSSFGCAQSCFLISVGLALLLFAISCFGLWAILDYVLIEILGWPYRAPLTGLIPWLFLVISFS
ncbi:MAG: hypothetical protein KC425_16030 [Anaerolineales bacterium]|nr:hypothetical protein [Anaerolineales bacterium]